MEGINNPLHLANYEIQSIVESGTHLFVLLIYCQKSQDEQTRLSKIKVTNWAYWSNP